MSKKVNVIVGPTHEKKPQKDFFLVFLIKSLWQLFLSLDLFLKFFVIVVICFIIYAIYSFFSPVQDTRSRAAEELTPTPIAGKTASIVIVPASGEYALGKAFDVELKINGGGQLFNAAKATITVSTNLQIENLEIIPFDSGGCNFTWANKNSVPTVNNLSFSGAILKSSLSQCSLYKATLKVLSLGTGTINLSKASVVSYDIHKDILAFIENGSYQLVSLSKTPTPTQIPTPTNTPTPTLTPTIFPTNTPTPTPVMLQAPEINNQPTDTYDDAVLISGKRMAELITIYINNSSIGISYPNDTTWFSNKNLVVGINNFEVFGRNISGIKSESSFITIVRHILGDISGDGIVDLTDLSMFATDYENLDSFNYNLSDMNKDGVVDLLDFSIIAKQYND